MNVEIKRSGNRLTAFLSGEIDHHSAVSIRTAIDKELDRGNATALILDFGAVNFMDSSGLGMIFGRYKKMNSSGGTLKLQNVPKPIERILRMAGVYTIIGISGGGKNEKLS